MLNCPICMELLSPSNSVSGTKCGHMFHSDCLSRWLERSKTCPQCRDKILLANVIKLHLNWAQDVGESNNSPTRTVSLDVDLLSKNIILKHQLSEEAKQRAIVEKDNEVLKLLNTKITEEKAKLKGTLKAHELTLKSMSIEVGRCQALEKRVNDLSKEVNSYKYIKVILEASKPEADKMLQDQYTSLTDMTKVAAVLKRQLIESEMQYRKLQATLTSKKETIRNLKTDMLGIMKELESIKEENTHLLERAKENCENRISSDETVETNEVKTPSNPIVINMSDINPPEKRKIPKLRLCPNNLPAKKIKKFDDPSSPYLSLRYSNMPMIKKPLVNIPGKLSILSNLAKSGGKN